MTTTNKNAQVYSAPEMMNDAEVIASDHPDLAAFYNQQFTFMTGQLYGQGDRRNTRDGAWKAKTLTLLQWLEGGENANGAGWGLSRHPVAKAKGGASIVPSVNIAGQRKDMAVKTMTAIVIDIDGGASLDEVADRAEASGYFCTIYTTYNHRKTVMELKHDEVIQKLGLDDTPNLGQVQEYLRLHHKDPLSKDFIDQIEITDARRHVADGVKIILKTPPIDKFRVIFPLAEAVDLADLAPTMNGYKEKWADAVTGVAVNILGSEFDSTSCDINRLFFTPRHAKDSEWYSAIVEGKPLAFDDIKPYSKTKYVNERKAAGDPFMAGDEGGTHSVPRIDAPSGLNLNEWHRKFKERFNLADVLETYASDKVRTAGGERAGTVHVECPFESDHSSTGGTATMAMNPEANKDGVWTMFCKHDACQGRHKLEFLQQMLEDQWFDETLLLSDSFMVPLPDPDDDAAFNPTPGEKERIREDARQSGINADSLDADLKKHFKKMIRVGDESAIAAEIERIANQVKHPLGKRGLNKLVKEVRTDARESKQTKYPIVNRDDFEDQWRHGEKALLDANGNAPTLFTYQGDLCAVHDGARVMLGERQFAAIMNQSSKWVHATSAGDKEIHREVAAPNDVVQMIFNRRDKPWPELAGIKTTPYFSRDGRLVIVEGYDPESQTKLELGNLSVPRVSAVPSGDEVTEAKRLMFGEAFHDFPFGGMGPDEMLDAVMGGGECPDAAHLLCMTLQPFVRDMIDGVTPVYAVTKPLPGTGGGLLVELASTIAEGVPAAAQPMPTTEEELTKTITAIANHGANWCFFDNMNVATVSGNFASAITAQTFKARLLGSSRMVEAPLRHVWVMVANNIKGSPEILRRSVMIELDAGVARPETRTEWKHDDIRAWVSEHRGELVWACLTLVQNWIAKGQERYSDAVLSSFEGWSNVMGGILRDAGVKGFLGNVERLRSYAATAVDSGVQQLMDELATYEDGTAFRAGGTAKIRGKEAVNVVSIMNVLNSCGEDGGALLIDGMGYSKDGEGYSRSQKIADRFKDFARVPWECATHDITFAEHPDPRSPKQLYWVMTKTKPDATPPSGG